MFSLFGIVMAIQVISALAIIVLVLLQQGKGVDMGSAFGSGSAGSLFGASGAANFLSRVTKWAAIIFFITTGTLSWIGHQRPGTRTDDIGLMKNYQSKNLSVPHGPSIAIPASKGLESKILPSTSVPSVPQISSSSVPDKSAAKQ